MTTKRGHTERERDLTPRERLKAAFLYEIEGIAQHTLAVAFEVNQGRIAEAVAQVRKACGISTK